MLLSPNNWNSSGNANVLDVNSNGDVNNNNVNNTGGVRPVVCIFRYIIKNRNVLI